MCTFMITMNVVNDFSFNIFCFFLFLLSFLFSSLLYRIFISFLAYYELWTNDTSRSTFPFIILTLKLDTNVFFRFNMNGSCSQFSQPVHKWIVWETLEFHFYYIIAISFFVVANLIQYMKIEHHFYVIRTHYRLLFFSLSLYRWPQAPDRYNFPTWQNARTEENEYI